MSVVEKPVRKGKIPLKQPYPIPEAIPEQNKVYSPIPEPQKG